MIDAFGNEWPDSPVGWVMDHPYNSTNTYAWRGKRICRACRNAYDRSVRARRTA